MKQLLMQELLLPFRMKLFCVALIIAVVIWNIETTVNVLCVNVFLFILLFAIGQNSFASSIESPIVVFICIRSLNQKATKNLTTEIINILIPFYYTPCTGFNYWIASETARQLHILVIVPNFSHHRTV